MTLAHAQRLTLFALLGAGPLASGSACLVIDADADADAGPTAGSTATDPTTSDASGTSDGDPGTTEGDSGTTDDDPTITELIPQQVLSDAGPDHAVAALALSPAGDQVVAALGANRVVVFSLANTSATLVHTIGAGDLFEPSAAVWGAKGFAIGTFSHCLVFDAAGSLIHELPDRCSYLTVSADGETLVRTTTDAVATVGFESGSVTATAAMVSPSGLGFDGDRVHVLENDGQFSIASRTLPNLDGPVSHPIDVRALSGGPLRGTLLYAEAKLWSDFAASPVVLITEGLEDQKALAVSGDRRWAASLGYSAGLHVYDAATGQHLAEATLDTTSAAGLAFDASADRLFAGSSAGVAVFTIVKQ
ncbi:hypothetical protein [Enhygromyxa salina]|uniref:Uncharacterized protein n=1 Tax=Enhygromyxa salina TaxID=215803 RepID=A0A2S9YCJ3_9BACT|nr:hypothetical protein [Enhygromyxa salina]PRQ02721.1 hypothetical protein ENSA7_55500 [Enhygromyxa salina]